MSRLRALLPSSVAQPRDSVLSPVSTGPGSLSQASSAELVGESPRRTRRAKRRMRPVRVMERSVGDLPILMIQDPSDVQGVLVYDCRPPLLPVSLQLSDIGPLSGQPTVVSASVDAPPWEDGLMISGVGSDVLVVPELGIAPLVDSGMDLEDELPTVLDNSLSYLASPTCLSLISASLRTDDASRSPSGLAPMDQYLPRDTSLCCWGSRRTYPFCRRF